VDSRLWLWRAGRADAQPRYGAPAGPGGRLAVGSLADRVSNSLLRVFAAAQAMVVVVTNCIPVNEAYAIEYAPVLRTLHVYVLRDSWSCS
jgi:hypothetical protein